MLDEETRLVTGVACAAMSREYNVPLFGTAPRVATWFLLEYPQPWAAKALVENHVPEAAMRVLLNQLRINDNARLQFIKREERAELTNLTLYVALVDELDSALYKISLNTYADLERIDFDAIIQQKPAADAYRTHKPLFTICTNEARDACCAGGQVIYHRFAQQAGVDVWQTTHLGGHRFAPTLVGFPHGVYYGHVDAQDVPLIIEAHHEGRLYNAKSRGRTCYDPVAQAAEFYLRQATDVTLIDALHLVNIEDSPGGWWVSFRILQDSLVHRLHIRRSVSPVRVLASCDKDELVPVHEYQLIDYAITGQDIRS